MEQYSFTVGVTGIEVSSHPWEDALYEAGCDDALVAVVNGQIQVDFDRTASSYEEAVQSATVSIQKAGGTVNYVERLN
jgi:hypothetical protein